MQTNTAQDCCARHTGWSDAPALDEKARICLKTLGDRCSDSIVGLVLFRYKSRRWSLTTIWTWRRVRLAFLLAPHEMEPTRRMIREISCVGDVVGRANYAGFTAPRAQAVAGANASLSAAHWLLKNDCDTWAFGARRSKMWKAPSTTSRWHGTPAAFSRPA